MDPIVLKKLNEIIFYYIHEAPRLRRLFIRWSHLELSDRIHIDEIMQVGLQEKQNQLYISLRDALEAWEHLQDTQGAPGFQSGSVQCACAKGIENDLICIMTLLENCLDKIYEQKYSKINNQQIRTSSIIVDVENDDHIVGIPILLSNEEKKPTTKLIYNKKTTKTDSKSDSRLSCRSGGNSGTASIILTKTRNGPQHRSRSTSASDVHNHSESNNLQRIKSIHADWVKLPTNGYRSE